MGITATVVDKKVVQITQYLGLLKPVSGVAFVPKIISLVKENEDTSKIP